MSVKVRVELGIQGQPWQYDYFEREDFLHADCAGAGGPLRTLQGALELVVKRASNGTLAVIDALAWARPGGWQVEDQLQVPTSRPGQIYVVEDVIDEYVQMYLTNADYSIFCALLVRPQPDDALLHIAIAEQVVVGITRAGVLARIWLRGLPPQISQAQEHRGGQNAEGVHRDGTDSG